MITFLPSHKDGAIRCSYAYSQHLILKNIATIAHHSDVKSSMNNMYII